jgi:hypothetical protein
MYDNHPRDKKGNDLSDLIAPVAAEFDSYTRTCGKRAPHALTLYFRLNETFSASEVGSDTENPFRVRSEE